MEAFAASTIATLCYKNLSGHEFTSLTSDLASALWAGQLGAVDIRTQYDDFMIFDLPTVRICLAHSDFAAEFSGDANSPSGGLLVSVGSHEGTPEGDQMFENRAALLKALVNRIETVRAPEEVILLERNEVFSEEGFDALIEDIWKMVSQSETNEALEIEATPVVNEIETTVIDEAQPAEFADSVLVFAGQSPDDFLPALEARFEVEHHRRARLIPQDGSDVPVLPVIERAPRPAAAALANSTDLHAMQLAKQAFCDLEARKLREALYPSQRLVADAATANPLLHRAAIHAMNAFVLAFALPLGATMMTLAVLGRESWVMSARATAVTGAFAGLAQSETAMNMLSLLN